MALRTKQLQAWIAAEHARLHLVAAWPESARKRVLLFAIQSSIRLLLSDPDAATFRCVICRTGQPATVLLFAPRTRPTAHIQNVAA